MHLKREERCILVQYTFTILSNNGFLHTHTHTLMCAPFVTARE